MVLGCARGAGAHPEAPGLLRGGGEEALVRGLVRCMFIQGYITM